MSVLPKALSLVSTVLLLMSLGFFVLSCTPLLILKHEVPMDSRVIRQVFHYCYRIVTVFATAGAIGYALAGRTQMSLGIACVALLAVVMHHWLVGQMDKLRTTMHDGDRAAVTRFRQLHLGGIALNLAQLVVLGYSMTSVTF